MTNIKAFAVAAMLSSVIATPVLARDNWRVSANRDAAMSQQVYDEAYDSQPNTGFFPADVAGGIVGDAVGTAGLIAGGAVNAAGAIAAAPFGGRYAYDNGYGYDGNYRQSYAQRNGFVCEPGTLFRGEDGRQHICQ